MYYWDVIRVLLKVHVIVFSICIVIFTECEKMASSKKGKKKSQKSKLPAAPFKLSSEDLKLADKRTTNICVPVGYGWKPGPFFFAKSAISSHMTGSRYYCKSRMFYLQLF